MKCIHNKQEFHTYTISKSAVQKNQLIPSCVTDMIFTAIYLKLFTVHGEFEAKNTDCLLYLGLISTWRVIRTIDRSIQNNGNGYCQQHDRQVNNCNTSYYVQLRV